MQFDRGYKGFSFSKEGPLDMRMDPTSSLSAKEIVNTWSEKDLGEIFKEYGEESKWRQMAKAIVFARRKQKIETTTQLAAILEGSMRGRGKLHPATLVFQALRICVNNELGSLTDGLSQAIGSLNSGGRIGVISFHSLEDRIVKQTFKEASFVPKRERGQQMPLLKLLTKKPIVAEKNEMRVNPRSRSAKLRAAEKV